MGFLGSFPWIAPCRTDGILMRGHSLLASWSASFGMSSRGRSEVPGGLSVSALHAAVLPAVEAVADPVSPRDPELAPSEARKPNIPNIGKDILNIDEQHDSFDGVMAFQP
jgi:hypothetical protein